MKQIRARHGERAARDRRVDAPRAPRHARVHGVRRRRSRPRHGQRGADEPPGVDADLRQPGSGRQAPRPGPRRRGGHPAGLAVVENDDASEIVWRDMRSLLADVRRSPTRSRPRCGHSPHRPATTVVRPLTVHEMATDEARSSRTVKGVVECRQGVYVHSHLPARTARRRWRRSGRAHDRRAVQRTCRGVAARGVSVRGRRRLGRAGGRQHRALDADSARRARRVSR